VAFIYNKYIISQIFKKGMVNMQQYNISYRKKDNSWQYIISYKDGLKWKQKSKQGFSLDKVGKMECKEAAEKMVEELKIKMDLQGEVNPEYDGITFKKFADMFIEHEKLYKEANTIRTYKVATNAFKSIHTLKMSEITAIHIQRCIDKMIEKKISNNTIKKYLKRIETMFNKAMKKYKIIATIPTANIDVPKDKIKIEKIALTKSELNMLLSKIENKHYYAISLVASKCGLRIGEIMGLKWSDVSMDKCILSVNKQWKKKLNGGFDFGELKSFNSNREVPIPIDVVMALKKYKNETPANIDGRIFKQRNNESIGFCLQQTYKKLGFDISVHELRHTYATTLIANGVDFKTVAKLMGHDVEQTIKTYSHVNDDMMKNATDLINKIF
jgi:integrase